MLITTVFEFLGESTKNILKANSLSTNHKKNAHVRKSIKKMEKLAFLVESGRKNIGIRSECDIDVENHIFSYFPTI